MFVEEGGIGLMWGGKEREKERERTTTGMPERIPSSFSRRRTERASGSSKVVEMSLEVFTLGLVFGRSRERARRSETQPDLDSGRV